MVLQYFVESVADGKRVNIDISEATAEDFAQTRSNWQTSWEPEIEFAPMKEETVNWIDELLDTCRRFGIDYYKATDRERVFAEEVARKNYALKQADKTGAGYELVMPFMGIKRAAQ